MDQLQNAPAPQLFEVSTPDGDKPYMALPPNWKGELVEPRLDVPTIIRERQTAANTEAFSAYLDRFKDARTILFASRTTRYVTARLDYHETATQPSSDTHSLARPFKPDRKFEAWKKLNGKDLTQIQFVNFLEDHLADVSSPDQATLLRSIVQFKALRQVNCASAVNLSNGDLQFQYTQDTKSESGQVVMPERIQITVPVLEFESEWAINARLSYVLGEGRLTFKFQLIQIEDVEDLAFATAVEQLSKAVGAQILLQD